MTPTKSNKGKKRVPNRTDLHRKSYQLITLYIYSKEYNFWKYMSIYTVKGPYQYIIIRQRPLFQNVIQCKMFMFWSQYDSESKFKHLSCLMTRLCYLKLICIFIRNVCLEAWEMKSALSRYFFPVYLRVSMVITPQMNPKIW